MPPADVHAPRWQVQILVPETTNPSYGVVRTLVRDSNDEPNPVGIGTFLDSDNTVSQIGAANRSTIMTLTVPPLLEPSLAKQTHRTCTIFRRLSVGS